MLLLLHVMFLVTVMVVVMITMNDEQDCGNWDGDGVMSVAVSLLRNTMRVSEYVSRNIVKLYICINELLR